MWQGLDCFGVQSNVTVTCFTSQVKKAGKDFLKSRGLRFCDHLIRLCIVESDEIRCFLHDGSRRRRTTALTRETPEGVSPQLTTDKCVYCQDPNGYDVAELCCGSLLSGLEEIRWMRLRQFSPHVVLVPRIVHHQTRYPMQRLISSCCWEV